MGSKIYSTLTIQKKKYPKANFSLQYLYFILLQCKMSYEKEKKLFLCTLTFFQETIHQESKAAVEFKVEEVKSLVSETISEVINEMN